MINNTVQVLKWGPRVLQVERNENAPLSPWADFVQPLNMLKGNILLKFPINTNWRPDWNLKRKSEWILFSKLVHVYTNFGRGCSLYISCEKKKKTQKINLYTKIIIFSRSLVIKFIYLGLHVIRRANKSVIISKLHPKKNLSAAAINNTINSLEIWWILTVFPEQVKYVLNAWTLHAPPPPTDTTRSSNGWE